MYDARSCWIALTFAALEAGCGGSVDSSETPTTVPPADTDSGPTQVDAPPPAPALAQGLPITGIALFQGVKVDLVKNGTRVDTRNAPVVAARPGMLRVYVTPDGSWSPREVEADLQLVAADGTTTTLMDTKTISAASTDANTKSTFDFDLSAGAVASGVTYSVRILDHAAVAQPGDRTDAQYPSDGSTDDLGALATSAMLELVFVPLRYDADGSGRLPDTSVPQIQRYHDTLFKMYPTARVDITVAPLLPWSTAISPDGTGWDQVMQAVFDQRGTDRAKRNVFYVGLFEPSASLAAFCSGGGCVLGLAPLVSDPNSPAEQIALTVGYSGQLGPNTLNQELAHAMGRSHAPCGGAGQIDRKFPYSGARIGVWGYDILKKTLVDPGGNARDFMSYCDPIWVSDYTFQGLFDRLSIVDKGFKSTHSAVRRSYRMVHVAPDGSLRVGRSVSLDEEPHGEVHAIELVTAGAPSDTKAMAHYFPYDNIAGGFALVDEEATMSASAMRIPDLSSSAASIPR